MSVVAISLALVLSVSGAAQDDPDTDVDMADAAIEVTVETEVRGEQEPQSQPTKAAEATAPSALPAVTCEPDPSSPTGYSTQIHGGGAGFNGFGMSPSGALGPCTLDEPATAQPARITPGRVLQAFRRIPLPAATLDIQPPGGKTLVNLDTIFSTTASDLDRTVTLLGRRVQLRITPTSYTWHHGDGTTQTSDWPGRPWEKDLDISVYLTHSYEDAQVTVRPSVDVTYAADYRIGNGPWQPVDGTVTIDGPPSALRILEARPVLTGAGR